MFVVTLQNLRTSETKVVRRYGRDHVAATERARWSNELARVCGMTHFLYRAIWEVA